MQEIAGCPFKGWRTSHAAALPLALAIRGPAPRTDRHAGPAARLRSRKAGFRSHGRAGSCHDCRGAPGAGHCRLGHRPAPFVWRKERAHLVAVPLSPAENRSSAAGRGRCLGRGSLQVRRASSRQARLQPDEPRARDLPGHDRCRVGVTWPVGHERTARVRVRVRGAHGGASRDTQRRHTRVPGRLRRPGRRPFDVGG